MIAAQITPGVKVYEGRHDNDGSALVRVNGRPLSPDRSLAVRDHSPTGFSWGYAGTGSGAACTRPSAGSLW